MTQHPNSSTHQRRIGGPLVALLASAFFFNAAHSEPGHEPALESNEITADFEAAIAEMRWEIGQDRGAIVEANMYLTTSEKGIFWPLYGDYRRERNKVTDRRIAFITTYISERDTMTEAQALELTRQHFVIEREVIAVKEKYVKKMSKVLSARTVARFFHIDEKLDTALELALATGIPLVK